MNCPLCDFSNLADVASCRACGSPLRDTGVAATTQSSEDDDALPTGAILSLGAYRVERVLGQGGFGITYLCRDLRLERAVAIKEFFPSGCRRAQDDVRPSRALSASDYTQAKNKFLEEARVLARFKHAGIVDVHTVFEENNSAYMVMEFLEGKSLLALLRERGARQMPEDEALHYIERAGDALSAVHDRGLLHRDLKPDNIIACNDGRVMLIDFGTAREYSAQQTHGHTVVVTPGYAPLEQYAQQARRGAYTDVYGLAATLYHLLTGEVPAAASDRAMGVELVPPRELNPHMSTHVARAIETALQTETVRRPQTARAFLDLLHDTSAPQTATRVESLDATGDNGWQKTDSAPNEAHLSDADLDEMWADRKQPSVDFSALIRARKDLLQSAGDAALSSQSYGPQTSDTGQAAAFGPIDQGLNLNTLSGKPLSSTNFLTGGATSWDNSQDWLFNSPQPDAQQLQQSGPASDASPALPLVPFVPAARRGLSPTPACFKDPTPYPSSGPVGYALPPMTRFWRWLAALACGGWIFAMSISQGRVHSPDPGRSIRYIFDSPGQASVIAAPVEVAPLAVPVLRLKLPLEGKEVKAAAFSRDGKTVAYADDFSVKLWDIKARRVRSSVKRDAKGDSAGASPIFSPDCSRMAVLNNKTLTVWNLPENRIERVWPLDQKGYSGGFFLSDTQLALRVDDVQTRKFSFFLCNIKTGQQRELALSSSDTIIASPDGKTLLEGDSGGSVTWRDAKTGRIKALRPGGGIRQPYGSATSHWPWGIDKLLFSPDGTFSVAVNQESIKIFGSSHREINAIIASDESPMAFSPDNKLLATYLCNVRDMKEPDVHVRNCRTGQLVRLVCRESAAHEYSRTFPFALSELKNLAFSADNKSLFGVTAKGVFLQWDLGQQSALRAFDPQPQQSAADVSAALQRSGLDIVYAEFLPNGDMAQLTKDPQRVLVWNGETGALRRAVTADFGQGDSTVFSPNGEWMITGAYVMNGKERQGETSRVWNLRDGTLKREWHRQFSASAPPWPMPSGHFALSPDGTRLVSAATIGAEKSIVDLWDVGSGKRLITIPSDSFAASPTFAPDGKTWVQVESDNKSKPPKAFLQWRDAQTGALLRQRPVKGPQHLTYLSNGMLAASGISDFQLFDARGRLTTSIAMTGNVEAPIAVSPDQKTLAVCDWDSISTIDLASATILQKLSYRPAAATSDSVSPEFLDHMWGKRFRALRFSNNGTQLQGISYSGRRIVWHLSPLTADTISEKRRN